jgi:hypothetical protein
MAQAYPASKFTGFDHHEPSIVAAREAAAQGESGDRVRFEKAAASVVPGRATTSSASSMRCTTWATRSAPRAHVRESLRWMAPGCWSSHSRDALEKN